MLLVDGLVAFHCLDTLFVRFQRLSLFDRFVFMKGQFLGKRELSTRSKRFLDAEALHLPEARL